MATQNSTLTQDQVKFLFDYKDGVLYWKQNVGKIKANTKAGSILNSGYCSIVFNGTRYQAHRLVYLLHHGYLPQYIDHIDGNRLNNFIANLRPATKSQNALNKRLDEKNTSGYRNVYWHKAYKKWRVSLMVARKTIHIGSFDDLELAGLVATEARKKYHGEFARI